MDWVSACSALLLGGQETLLRNFKNTDLKKKKKNPPDWIAKTKRIRSTSQQHNTSAEEKQAINRSSKQEAFFVLTEGCWGGGSC